MAIEGGETVELSLRNKKILDELISNPSINSAELEKKYNLTRRQLGYSIYQLNEWLQSKDIPALERTRQGHFIINEDVFILINGESKLLESNILSEKQRVYFIVMILLSSQEELSLNHFTFELDVSKNTILNDLKQVQTYLKDYNLKIEYSRKNGYVITGQEFQIRKLLIEITNELLINSNNKRRIKQLIGIENKQIQEFTNRIEKVENELNLKFTDEKMEMMPYILILILRRIERGNVIKSKPIEYKELADTKEYQATEKVLYDYKDIPIAERLFITLHLLTTNIHWSESVSLIESDIPNLVPSIESMLVHFEKSTCIYFQNRERLMNKLLQHIKPAYYRIKFQLTDKANFQWTFKNEFKELHHLVKRSLGPLENLIGAPIPEHEAAYITMLIGGWMKRHGKSIDTKVKAVVVCPHGVSVSRLLFNELRELFAEFIFLDTLSVREFMNYDLDYNVVFSPTYLETNKKLFITKTFLDNEDKIRLRKQVMLEMYGYLPNDFDIDQLMQIIKSHTIVNNETALIEDLQKYLRRDDQTTVKQTVKRKESELYELLTEGTILTKRSIASWEEAIRFTSRPLLTKGSITNDYIKAMIKTNVDPYIVISPNVAIAHAAPSDGVKELSMSLLRLEQGVEFCGKTINLVIVIAAIDRQQHIRALTQLTKLVANSERKNTIIQAKSPNEIYLLIKEYVNQIIFEGGEINRDRNTYQQRFGSGNR